jgi:PAS domain S-box-containing protein
MYDCKHLPAYASFLIDQQLESFAREQIALSEKMKIPLMASLKERFNDEQLLSLATHSLREYLQYLADNNITAQLKTSMENWLQDKLEIVGKMEISAQDITLINFIRAQNLKKFIPLYTADLELAINLTLEIDRIILGANTTAVDVLIDILKEQIAEQSNLATKVIAVSPAVTFLFDAIHFKQLFVSSNVTQVLGYTPEEIVQMGDKFLFDLTHPEDLGYLVSHLREVISQNSNKTDQVEFRFRHKDGSYRWLRTYEVVFRRDADGNPLELLGKTFEISREKETALALEKSEKQLLEAQSIAHIGSYEWNMIENKSNNTPEVFRIFEMDKQQRFEDFMKHVHPDDVQKVKDALAVSMSTGYYECEYRYVKNDKEKVIWSIGRIEFRDKSPYRMIGTVQDVTEIKKIERELVQKSEELAQTNESLRQFAYVASHDMKEPLRKIMMFSDLVLNNEKGNLSQRSVSQLQKMQASGRNLYRMVEDILSFSLLEAKETKQWVELVSIIGEVEELLDESIRAKNAKLIYNHLPEAFVIPSQFRQLFQNLVSNSLKFARSDKPPVIKITGEITSFPEMLPEYRSNKYLQLCIEDNGIGFPAEVSEKIFELFSRHHSKTQYEGTGLGLSISRRIVNNHNGVIKASPASNGGAEFRVVLPQ